MNYTPTDLLTVYLAGAERLKVGRLAACNRQILFEYDPAFVSSGIEISPFKLPLQPRVSVCPDTVFGGLYGVFNDSLPDGWGRLLLDRTVEQYGVNRHQLSLLDRLAYVGEHGMGALAYQPDKSATLTPDTRHLVLDRLAEESAIMLAGENEEVFEELLRLNGSSAGARPKIVAQVSADRKKIIHGEQALQPGHSHWLIKFAMEQEARDVGRVEYAYSLMARDAGLDMPEAHLFKTKKRACFGTQRFDRQGGQRVHVHSLSGLIHADHRTPSVDYDTVLRVTLLLTQNMVAVERAYALACFNVLAHNRDDHAKNISFLLTDRNEWTLAPVYDLTFSFGPGGEQSTVVMGEGRSPGIAQLTALGKKHGLKKASEILRRVQGAISRWGVHADEAGLGDRSAKSIAAYFVGS